MSAVQEHTSDRITRRWKLAGDTATPTPRPATTAVVIETGEHTAAGLLLVELALRGLEPTNVRIERGEALPDARTVDFAVVVGAEEPCHELTPSLVAWIIEADAAGGAIFAIGSGAQALARALGGDSAPESPGSPEWISALPVGAELISETPDDPRAFRIGRHIGVRFHPDTTPELIREWVPDNRQLFDLNETTVCDLPAARPAEHRLFAAFVDGALAA